MVRVEHSSELGSEARKDKSQGEGAEADASLPQRRLYPFMKAWRAAVEID